MKNRRLSALAATTLALAFILALPSRSYGAPQLVELKTFDFVVDDVIFIDAMTGYALGTRFQQIMKTTDGGVTWEARPSGVPTFYPYTAIAALDSDRLLIGDGSGSISILDHPDSTWRFVRQGSGNNADAITQIEIVDDRHWVATTDSLVLSTTDAGETWRTFDPDSTGFNGISRLHVTDAGLMHIALSVYTILRSTDGGATFTPLDGPTHSFGHLYDVHFTSPDTGFVASWYPWNLFTTTDGGATWTAGPFEYPTSIVVTPIGSAAYVTSYGSILRTGDDGGMTWSDSTAIPPRLVDDREQDWERPKLIVAGESDILLLLTDEENRVSILLRIEETTGVSTESGVFGLDLW